MLISERVKEDNEARLKVAFFLSLLYIFKRQEYFLFNRSYVVYRDLYFYRQRVLVSQWSNFDHCDDGYSSSMTMQTALNHIPQFDFIDITAINVFLIYSFFFVTSRIFLITLIL